MVLCSITAFYVNKRDVVTQLDLLTKMTQWLSTGCPACFEASSYLQFTIYSIACGVTLRSQAQKHAAPCMTTASDGGCAALGCQQVALE